MNTNTKLITSVMLAITCMLMSRCKSPQNSNETEVIATDTIATSHPIKSDTIAADTISLPVPLTLTIGNLASPTAPVSVGVYGRKNKFLDNKDQLKEYKFTPNGNTLTAQITDLGYGEFAIAIYQDVNQDGKYNKTPFGLPKEPYGFSNNYKPVFKAPGFDDCKFNYNTTVHEISMNMIR